MSVSNDFLYEVGKRIEANGIASFEEDLFVHYMPADVTVGTLLIEPLRGLQINHELIGYHDHRYELVHRNTDYDEGFSVCAQLIDALTVAGEKVGDFEIQYLRAAHWPVPYPINDGDLIEFSIAFDANFSI